VDKTALTGAAFVGLRAGLLDAARLAARAVLRPAARAGRVLRVRAAGEALRRPVLPFAEVRADFAKLLRRARAREGAGVRRALRALAVEDEAAFRFAAFFAIGSALPS
jgi:hypothetical protein